MTPPSTPPEWAQTIEAVAERGGLVLILGAVDTGKTTFARELANCAVAAGIPTGVVDADIGQSEIGPPTCVSVGLVTEPVTRLSDIKPVASGFVGSVTPQHVPLEHLAQTCQMVSIARERGAKFIICDTTGLAAMSWSHRLKRCKLDALRPDQVVALARRQGVSALARVLRSVARPIVHHVPVPDTITVKTPALRAQRRAARFAEAFANAVVREWPFEEVVIENSWLGCGAPLGKRALDQLGAALDVQVEYAEQIGNRLGIVARTLPPYETAQAVASRLYGAQAVLSIPSTSLERLVVGLYDRERTMVGIGLVVGLDAERRILKVTSSAPAMDSVRIIRLGAACWAADGRIIPVYRNGDV